MTQFIAIALAAFTLTIWGGALAAVIGAGFHLLFNAPWLMLLIFGAIFILPRVM
jgi:hypothetical protein